MREGLSRLLPVLVAALFCLPLFVGLGRTDLQNDESIYSFAVDRILETGIWLTPKSSPDENAPFFEKPPLKFWIVAAPIRLGLLPHNEFGLRFWDALFGGIVFLYVFLIGRRMAGPLCGFASVAVLFVHWPLLFDHGLRSNNMEAALVLAYCGGMYHFLAWTEKRRRRSAMALALYFVLGFMTKFVAALFLPLVLGVSALVVPAWRRDVLRGWRIWIAASALATVLIAPWFIYQHVVAGSEFWEILFGVHVFKRMTVSIDPGHLHPWDYYWRTMLVVLSHNDTLPLVLGGAALLLVQVVRRRGEYVLVALWFALPLALISISPSKIYHYAYPFIPPVAIMAGLVPAWLWQIGQARVTAASAALDTWTAERGARVLVLMRRVPVAYVLLALAFGAIVLASLAAVGIGVRWTLAPGVVVRNARVLRPWMIAFVLAALAGRSLLAGRLLVPLVILAILPWTAYRDSAARLPVENHPQRDARDCIVGLIGTEPPPGAYVQIMEGSFVHSYYYYFRRFGPWEWQHEADDPGLYANLFAPSAHRPILISDQRYSDFRRHVREADDAMLQQMARAADVPPGSVSRHSADASIPMVRLGYILILVPGRYSVCSDEARILAHH